jgi:hypothetical protein
VLLINIDDCSSFVKDDSIKEHGLAKLVLENIFTELFSPDGNVFPWI